jgi:16S rRNA processing protein RimM
MEKILIGKIVGTSGIKGFVRVLSYAETPTDLGLFKNYYSDQGDKLELIKLVSAQKSVAVLSFRGIKTLELAKNLVGLELFIPSEDLPQLEEGEIYYKDLIGLPVYFDETLIGKAINLCNYGASDLIEVRELNGESNFYPFTETFIIKIEEDKIIMRKPELV